MSSADWQHIMKTIREESFSSPWRSPDEKTNKFLQYTQQAIKKENMMHFQKGSLIPYVGSLHGGNIKGQEVPDYSKTNHAHVSDKPCTVEKVIEKLMSHLFAKTNNPHHPLFLPNVVPPPTIAAVIAGMISMKLNSNIIDEHYSMNTAKAELEVSSMISHLMPLGHGDGKWSKPWAPPSPDSSKYQHSIGFPEPGQGSGGIATFGGTGCYMYGIKYALTKVANSVLKEKQTTRASGFENGKFVIMVSNQGHYCSSNVTDWCGIGSDNVIAVRTYQDNTMDLNDLKSKLEEAKNRGKIVVAVVPTVGTTDAGALDDIRGIRNIIRNFKNGVDPSTKKRYAKPLIYADSVTGWIWLFFRKYDFDENPLKFKDELMEQIKFNVKRAETLTEADAFGVDFHKTGYCSYTASMIMFKDYGDFCALMHRDPPPYLQQEQYDPGLYTLETSRTSVGCVSAWSSFRQLGKNGFCALTHNLLDITNYLRKKLTDTGFIVICNPNNYFYSTLFRVYPQPYTQQDYENELGNEDGYNQFSKVNDFQKAIHGRMYENLRKNDGSEFLLSTPHISMTTGFRHTYYNHDGNKVVTNSETNEEEPMENVFALKVYLNSPFIERHHMDIVVQHIIRTRNVVINDFLQKAVLEEFKTFRKSVYEKLPLRVHKRHNAIPPLFIPAQYILAEVFDHKNDPDFTKYCKKIQLVIKEVEKEIENIQKTVLEEMDYNRQ